MEFLKGLTNGCKAASTQPNSRPNPAANYPHAEGQTPCQCVAGQPAGGNEYCDLMESKTMMNFISKIKSFKEDESGAVTVDWVVLTAAIVGLGIAVLTTVSSGVGNMSTDISTGLTDQNVSSYTF